MEDQSDEEARKEEKINLEETSKGLKLLEQQIFQKWVNLNVGRQTSLPIMTMIYDNAVAELKEADIPVSMSYLDFRVWYDRHNN